MEVVLQKGLGVEMRGEFAATGALAAQMPRLPGYGEQAERPEGFGPVSTLRFTFCRRM